MGFLDNLAHDTAEGDSNKGLEESKLDIVA